VGQAGSVRDRGRTENGLADFAVAKIGELATDEKPFLIEHRFVKLHCDNHSQFRRVVDIAHQRFGADTVDAPHGS